MAKQRLEEIRKTRLEKVKKLKRLGINPYVSSVSSKTEPIAEVRFSEGKVKEAAGRIRGWRAHGNSVFADLTDATGKIQLFFQKKRLPKKFKLLKLFDIGDFMWVIGRVFKTQAGEVTIDVNDFELLTKSIRPLPSSWHGLKDIEERYRKRYVDLLMNDEVRKVFEKRAEIVALLKKYLGERGFLEVKTPALQSVYGGATARPFTTHHNALDIDLYLRISDELYLKRLIVGGFEKVYEICTDFRNEGIDRWHNPEFSMLEFYWAYVDYEDLMKFTEKMLSSIAKKVTGDYVVKYGEMGVDFKPPWKRLKFKDAMLEHAGVDIDKFDKPSDLKKEVKKKIKELDLKGASDLPSIYDVLYKNVIREKLISATFLIDHPYEMRPLAKRQEDDPSKVQSFQLVAAGSELINAYSELNDPKDQRARWKEDMRRAKESEVSEYQVVDEDYIRALEYGMPPTAGWGLGIDRFVAILTNQHSLKDVILFPTLRPEK